MAAMALHEWAIKLASWREPHELEGGEGDENPSNAVIGAGDRRTSARW